MTSQGPNIAYIMRGVSGSGKSTVARKLAGEVGKIHSTDDFYMVDGVYVFDIEKRTKNHEANYAAFCHSLEQRIPVVICDNTNTKHWECQRYVDAAQKAGYIVAIVSLPHPDPKVAAARNLHGVTEEIILRQMSNWQA